MSPRRLLVTALAAALACSSGPGPEVAPIGPRGDAKTITPADLSVATQLNLLDYIAAERPQWLKTPDGRPSPAVVFVNDTRLGGVSTLQGLTITTISAVRYFDATAAQQKFNGVDRGPVIQVIMR
jgi:hypothetical protein